MFIALIMDSDLPMMRMLFLIKVGMKNRHSMAGGALTPTVTLSFWLFSTDVGNVVLVLAEEKRPGRNDAYRDRLGLVMLINCVILNQLGQACGASPVKRVRNNIDYQY